MFPRSLFLIPALLVATFFGVRSAPVRPSNVPSIVFHYATGVHKRFLFYIPSVEAPPILPSAEYDENCLPFTIHGHRVFPEINNRSSKAFARCTVAI